MKWLWIAGATCWLLGCGSSNVAFVDDAGDGTDTSTGSDTAVDDGSVDSITDSPPPDTPPIDTAPPPPPTLDNVCPKLASGVCGKAAEACCSKTGLKYDEAKCRAGVVASCSAAVAEVKAGTRKFHPEALGKCTDAWAKLETACNVNLIEFLRTYPPCQELFSGTVAAGSACKVDSDCASPTGAYSDCVDSGFPFGLVCRQYTVVGKDAACNLNGNVQAICDLGLACAVSGGPVPGDKGTCKPAKKPGEACDAAMWWECGYGYVCQGGGFPPSPAKCVEGKPAGSSCSREQDCASWQCTGYKCGSTSFPVASRELCGGG